MRSSMKWLQQFAAVLKPVYSRVAQYANWTYGIPSPRRQRRSFVSLLDNWHPVVRAADRPSTRSMVTVPVAAAQVQPQQKWRSSGDIT
jgi:hypothetical protein